MSHVVASVVSTPVVSTVSASVASTVSVSVVLVSVVVHVVSSTEVHVASKKKNLTGTARYASINALNGLTQSRRDDLEAVGYVLMYFLRGKLPWQGLRVKNKEDRYHKIMEIKKETSSSLLCYGFHKEFKKYEYKHKYIIRNLSQKIYFEKIIFD